MKAWMSADKLKREFETAPNGVSRILGIALRGMGFSISDDEVRAETERLLSGGEVGPWGITGYLHLA